MGEILKTWLRTRLGAVMDLRPEIFGRYTSDGTLLAQILHSYDIINSSQLDTIIHTQDPALSRVNLKHLRVWLRFIGVTVDDDCIEEISCGKGTTALQLFYKVYLCLENKDRLHFITLQKEREQYVPTTTKFDVTTVNEEPPPYEPPEHRLAASLIRGRETIEWHRGKFQAIIDACRRERERFETAQQQVVEPKEHHPKPPPVDTRKEDISQLDEFTRKHKARKSPRTQKSDPCRTKSSSIDLRSPISDPEAAKAYVKWLKQRKRRAATSHALKSRVQTMLLSEVWEKLAEKQEREFDEVIARRVLNQARYEKQMMTKLLDVRKQKDIIANNRKIVDDLMSKAKENEERFDEDRRKELAIRESEDVETECRRLCELRKRIREEKVRKMKEKHYRICSEILKDLADIAIQASNCRTANDGCVPLTVWNAWKALFIKSQPIFSLLGDGEEAECNARKERQSDEIEEIINLECERQEALNDADFENYHNLSSPWDKYVPSMEASEEETFKLGRIVLGHAVHRLLEFVYPYPAYHNEPPMPEVKVAAIVLGIGNPQLCEPLQTLLAKSNVRLVRVEDAINYCLTRYKDEMAYSKYVDLNIMTTQEETVKKMEGKRKAEGSKGKSPSTSRSAKTPRTTTSLRRMKDAEDKETQTPRVIPYDDVDPVLSDAAYVGKWTYEFLSLGQPISNELTAKIVVQYLKSLTEVDGWALVNYPGEYEQMACFEFALSGRKVPPDRKVIEFKDVNVEDIDPATPRIVYEDEDVDTFALYRQSRLLPNPILRPETRDATSTFITTYVRAIPKPKNLKTDERELFEVLPEDATSVDNYYADLSVAYVLYYTHFDVATLKRLARLIIGDMSLPRKSSFDLFGDALLQLQDEKEPNPVGSKAPIVRQIASSATINYDDAEQIEEADEGEDYVKSETNSRPATVKPGENGWTWIDFPQPSILLDALTTVWENLEEVYIENLKEIFFLKRAHAFAILPYKEFVATNMADFVARPDVKQDLLHSFHVAFNKVDADVRDDEEVKCELHCRTADFQAELWEICDARRKEAEAERQRVIRDHWTYYEAMACVNIYIGLVQTEIDRCVDTMQMLQDYYTSMMQRPLREAQFAKIVLERLQVDEERSSSSKEPDREPVEKLSKGKESKVKGTVKSSVSDIVEQDNLKEEIAALLIDARKESFDAAESSGYKTIFRVVKDVCNVVDTIASTVNEAFKKEDVALVSKVGRERISRKQSTETSPGSAKLSERRHDLLEEWRFAAMFEISRMRQRLETLKAAALSDMAFLLDTIRGAFHRIHKEIVERYEREIQSVNDMAATFCFAIEEGVPIQLEMLLDGDRFIVRSSVLLYPNEPTPTSVPAREAIHSSQFQITQLGRLTDIFKRVAPAGILSERSLVYILQDMISCGAEQAGTLPLPTAWLQLNSCDVASLIDNLFDSAVYVDWREFIAYAMDLPMPSHEEILNARDMFRAQDAELKDIVTRDQYHSTPLWFFECTETTPDVRHCLHEGFQRHSETAVNEDDNFGRCDRNKGIVIPKTVQRMKRGRNRGSVFDGSFSTETAELRSEEIVRLMLMKELLCQMYLASKHTVNYMALLLAVCKDEDPREGFAKMLSLVLGNPVCTSVDDGEIYAERLMEQKRIALETELTRDRLREEAVQAATCIINHLVDTVARGIIITEVIDFPDDVNLSSKRRLMIQVLDEKEETKPFDLLPESSENLLMESYSGSIEENNESVLLNATLHGRGSGKIGRPMVYWVPLNICLAILNTALPWHAAQDELLETSKSLRDNIILVYNELADEDLTDQKDTVLAHRLLNHSFIKELLGSTSKFTTKHMGNIFNNILRERNEALKIS